MLSLAYASNSKSFSVKYSVYKVNRDKHMDLSILYFITGFEPTQNDLIRLLAPNDNQELFFYSPTSYSWLDPISFSLTNLLESYSNLSNTRLFSRYLEFTKARVLVDIFLPQLNHNSIVKSLLSYMGGCFF